MSKPSKAGKLKIGRDKPKKYKRRPDAFSIRVIVAPTEEVFSVDDVYNDMTVAQLKDDLEFATGIPVTIQRLSYLDDGELQDHTTIRGNDFVPGSTVQLRVWPMYQELIEAIVADEIDWVFRLGVTNPSDYHTPASDYMTKRSRKAWLEERAFIALCLASHRGHEELAVRLIENGAEINRTTPTGKTPLHLASARGHGELVNTLLQHGADINAEDQNGNTALSVAERFGSKVCSRYLFQFQWQERAKDVKPSKKTPGKKESLKLDLSGKLKQQSHKQGEPIQKSSLLQKPDQQSPQQGLQSVSLKKDCKNAKSEHEIYKAEQTVETPKVNESHADKATGQNTQRPRKGQESQNQNMTRSQKEKRAKQELKSQSQRQVRRSHSAKYYKSVPLFAHQYHDSSFPVWKRGASAQIYVQKILKPGEFEGTALSAPKGGKHPSIVRKHIRNATFFRDSPDSNASELDDYFPDETGVSLPPIHKKKKMNLKRPLTYAEWLEKQREIERKIALEKKIQDEEDMKKKLEEEERKKEETEKLGYEKWLAQREQERLEKSPRHSSPVKNPSTVPDTSSMLPLHHDGALRQYLRGLGRSKAGVNYEDWLDQKEMEINHLVRQMAVQAPV